MTSRGVEDEMVNMVTGVATETSVPKINYYRENKDGNLKSIFRFDYPRHPGNGMESTRDSIKVTETKNKIL